MGKSQFHKYQSIGKKFKPNLIEGYPSDLTNKINWQGQIDEKGIILNKLTNGKLIYFPIAIAQKALGHYDNYLIHNNDEDITIFLKYTDFLIAKMDSEGLISTWHDQERNLLNDYSAMTQGQLISCCCRAFAYTNEPAYMNAAQKASYHITNLTEKNLLVKLDDTSLALSEMPNKNNSIILNGWFFSLWGLLELELIYPNEKLNKINKSIIDSIIKNINLFDTGFWSKYDNKNIASPFYHDLHIEQLKVMYHITQDSTFKAYIEKWDMYRNKNTYKFLSILIKAKQKLSTRKYNEFI
ncbi:D-glucuronyl C5-epimerase family protein [Providencia rettgeri]|uniref:D-glucuronyl C5-epimerase family protein n=1 Tax=Providencia rettgeri TaxID=587 RepID=UPI00257327FC|nr:D-glucuronyl C5-epimerase family protein [Providencia rettgeri]MDL9985127.1 D-glucuronyl C5-epimerase family protein [Providencia rettgeri]